ncbi:hypothetical protein QAD02_007297 [Eretmocerus hayati]|uniref:Uncharacterized protein n=1 Tax=Eretmocerus hayati TaxID=131215 RepID=A0ACC2N390_9HYME|nr:hypothetical protein QAD02_007297 [Eretmocerus hayati]
MIPDYSAARAKAKDLSDKESSDLEQNVIDATAKRKHCPKKTKLPGGINVQAGDGKKRTRFAKVDTDKLDQIHATQHATVKDLQALRSERRGERVDQDLEDDENDPLPNFPLKDLLSA